MSEGKQGRDMAAAVNEGEGEGRVAVPPVANESKGEVAVSTTVNEGEEKTGTTPMVDEGRGMDRLSPVMSYEPGIDDQLEPFTSEGETKYRGKGKDRSESFSRLPTPVQSAPSTAPSTRPVSEVQNDSGPSTAPSTRPVSEAQNDSGPSTAPSTRPASEAQKDPGPSTAPSTRPVSQAQDDPSTSTAPTTRPVSEAQNDPGPSTAPSEAQNDSGPSTAPSTRPVSQAQDDPSTSTAPTTKPASQAQTDPEPSVTDSTSSAKEDKADSAVLTAQGDSVSITGQGSSATPIGSGELAAIAAQSGSGSIEPQHNLPPRNISVKYDCGCESLYDDTGKKRQQACAQHRLNPKRSVLPSPPKRPLSESTNLPGVIPNLSANLPQVTRYEESPPRQPPVVTPTKGRHFVQGSEDGPTFLDPFNSDRAIEPTGPPDTLTTIPTQEDVPLKKKSSSGISNPMKSAPKLLGPKAPEPTTAPSLTKPPQAHQGASGSQTRQPRKLDAVEGQDCASRLPIDEQRTGEEIRTTRKRVEVTEVEESFPSDEDYLLLAGPEGRDPLEPVNSPHHRRNIQPKSILKKTVDPLAAGGQAESGMAYPGYLDSSAEDRSRGARLFQATIAKLRAGASSEPRQMAGSPLRVERGGRPTERLVLETRPGQEAFSVTSDDGDGGFCNRVKKYCPACLVM